MTSMNIYRCLGGIDPELIARAAPAEIPRRKKKKGWIKQAQKLGLTVNVWTVDDEAELRWVIEQGVDYITTDNPVLATELIKQMCK